MAMLCRAMQRKSSIRVTGLCHSVQGTAEMLAKWIGAPMDEITYVCAGHQPPGLVSSSYERNGKDAYPAHPQGRRRAARKSTTRSRSATRCSCTWATTSPNPAATTREYNWWFRKRPDLIEKYCTTGTGWNPGEYAYILEAVPQAREDLEEGRREVARRARSRSTSKRGHEYAASHHQRLAGRRAVPVQRQRAQHGPDHNLPPRRLRRGAGLADRNGLQRRSTSARCRRSARR